MSDADKVNAIYSLVERRIWRDTRGLSKPPPSGVTLWLYLLTTPSLGVLPGIIVAGERAMAEELGWDLEDFRRCWAEVEREGMAAADWTARVVVLPKTLDRHPPKSANVVRGWRRQWGEIPECPLKATYIAQLRAIVTPMGESFAEAFDATFGKETGKPSSKKPEFLRERNQPTVPEEPAISCPNQEQDQDQEQKQQIPPPPPPSGTARAEAVVVKLRGGGRPEDEGPERIRKLLQTTAELGCMATLEVGRRWWSWTPEGGSGGRIFEADMVASIWRADEVIASEVAAAGGVRTKSREQLVRFVEGCIRQPKRAPRESGVVARKGIQPPAAPGEEHWQSNPIPPDEPGGLFWQAEQDAKAEAEAAAKKGRAVNE
jgi:hypothetical protein